ncbi:biotin synthase auxiliary protein BsaP [Calidifontibacter terrae]
MTSVVTLYCARCGEPADTGDHATCQRWLAAEEPPRFCTSCRRRMKVQVTPTRWTAQCVEHGEISSDGPR